MAIKTKPTRKSRSYLNPEHQQDILAKAGAVSVPYRTAVKEVQHRVIEYVRAAYRSNPGFLTNHEDIDRLTALMAPALAAGQMQIADLTNAHLANLFHLENPPAVDVSKYGRPGVSRETELSRPFWTAIKAARQGKSVDEALAIGMRRMEKMLDTDFQMAKVIQSREALKAGGVQQYSRVAGPKACWLCSIAATQIYFTEDLLPIHPGCVVGSTLVESPSGLEATTRREFVGEVVELSTASGNFVRVTPNHPVLTDKGWVPAGLIRKGDNVFRSLRGERPVGGRPDVHKAPSRIEDVFASQSMTGRLVRMPIAAEDFHGDGSDGEVEIVWAASDLTLPVGPHAVEEFGEPCLMHTHGARVGLFSQGTQAPLLERRFATTGRSISSGGVDALWIAGGTKFNAPPSDFDGDGLAAYANQGRALINRLAGNIERDSVIQCRLVSFAGHVFNLQTVEGWYVADGVILSNCGCDVAPVPPGGQKTLDDVINPERLLEESDDQVKLMTAKVEEGATPSELRELVAVREHGETGPTLTWAHQKFTGPGDLPVPPSKEVLSHEVYDTVRANGGITIDLAGRRPDEGFAYAPYKTTEFKVAEAEFSPRHVEEYIDKHHKELVQPGNNLGMWVKDGYVYLDVSQVGPPTEATLAKAQAAHQLAVFDLDTFEEINLGTIDPTTKEFDPLGTPADLYRQYRGQVARADETVRARRSGPVSEGEGRSGTGSAATRLAPISDVTGEGEKLWPGTVKVARPTRRSDVNEMVGDHWGGLGYDELKDTIRLGVRKAQTQGYSGFKTESKDIDFKDERTRFELFGSDAGPEGPSEGMLLIEGKELAATAIHSKPTDAPLFRGMGIKAKDLKALTVGDELSLPASSFSSSPGLAEKFGRGDRNWWRSKDYPKNAKPVVIQLESGAKVAHIGRLMGGSEDVAFGRFEIIDIKPNAKVSKGRVGGEYWWVPPYDDDGVTVITVKQRSLVESEQGYVAARKAKGGNKIPEYTIVGKKQSLPDGLDHDEYGDRIWRLDGKVYSSRIDYENALGAKMVAEREAQKTAEVNGVPLYLDGVDPKGRKEIERAVKELTDKYPDGGLREVTTPRPDERSDPYDVAWTSGSKTITVNADREHFGNSEKFQEGEKRDRTTGYHPKLKRWSAEKATIYHEFGHVLDYQGLEVTHRQANKALKVAFLEDNPSFKKLKRGDPKLHAAYQKWLEDGLSSYSFQGGWKSLPGLKPARLNIGEAIAEAFTDVECNGDKASRPAQVLHDLVVKNAKPEAVQAERDRRTAEWQRKMHSDTSFKQAAKTPDEKAAAAEAKRVAAEQKKAARAVKAAEKRAEEAGQLFDPKIFGDKPKLPRESLESITSRFGGTDWAATTPIQKGKPRHSKKTGELLPPQNDWNATWALLPPIEVDMDGNIVDHALERNLRLVMESAAKHPWVIEAGDRWYPDYMKFVLHQWEMAGRRNPLTGKLMTFEQAMDASGAYAIDAGWNETMALYHNWQIGKPNPKDKKRNRYADEAASMNASLTGGRWYERAKVHESEKINDFTLNGKGNLWTSTTDRVVSRLALGTDDSEFAAGLLKAGFAGSYVDPKTGETVKLNGYERISRAIDRVAIQMGAPNPAAGQARMWIEFFGPEAACGLPPDDVVAEGLVSINEWTRQQVRDKIPGIDNVLPQWVSDILRTRGQKYKVKPLKLKL